MKVNHHKHKDLYYKDEERVALVLQNRFYDLLSLRMQNDIKHEEQDLQEKENVQFNSECCIAELKKHLNIGSDTSEECVAVKIVTGILAGATLYITKYQSELHVKLYLTDKSKVVISEPEKKSLEAHLSGSSDMYVRLEILNEE